MSHDQHNVAAVVWAADQNHAEKYAQSLNAKLYHIQLWRSGLALLAPFKYIPQAIQTWSVLGKQKPNVIYVMNPPVFAGLSVLIYCKLNKIPFVMDTHSPAIYGMRWGWSRPLQRFIARRAMTNIVDQERYKRLFESWGAKAVVLEKPPTTTYVEQARPDVEAKFAITVVNTFASDEPLTPILEAANRLPDVHFYVLGEKVRAKPGLIDSAPENVTFTDYLFKDDYWNQLKASRAVLVLTKHRYSLLAGAQDGMTVGRPLIISDKPALREYFTKGAIFVDNHADSIIDGINQLKAREETLTEEIRELAMEKLQRWESNFKQLYDMVGSAS
jgi:glycosyltransferase involved in cell wall biosynthesis